MQSFNRSLAEDLSSGHHSPASASMWPAESPVGRTLATEGPLRERITAIKAARNPLLEAAQPLLQGLAEMPAELDAAKVMGLHRLLERDVLAFQSICHDAQIRHEHAIAASYVLCTALDESASSTPWGGGQGVETGIWSVRQLAPQFHGDAKGGDKVFLLIGRLASTPAEHLDLLELLYFVLGLGFEGRFRSATGGPVQLVTIRSRILAILSNARLDARGHPVPQARGPSTAIAAHSVGFPVWTSVVVLGLVLGAFFGWYRYRLGQSTAHVEQQIAAIGQDLRLPVARATKPLALKELLGAEIARGVVTVEEDAQHGAVSFNGDEMFMLGKANLNPASLATLQRAAVEIGAVGGRVRVAGHSDNLPIRTGEFPDNQVLSERRAEAVAEILRQHGVSAERLQVVGKGDTEPRASNATPAGRALNRRVEVNVMYDEPTPSPAAAAAAGARF